MPSLVRFAGTLVVPVAVAVLAVACDGSDDPSGPDRGEVRVTVLADGTGESGVTVRLYDAGGSTARSQAATNASGAATFVNLDPGGYEVEVAVPTDLELPAGEDARRPVTVTAGATATVTFDLVSGGGGGDVEEVTLNAASFAPATLTIAPGTMVRWRNGGAVSHTITPDGHSEWSRVTMNQNGETFTHTFDEEGEFPYFCELHVGMSGTIEVAEP